MIQGTAAMDFTRFLARLCENYGCPETLTADGTPNLTAKVVEDFVQAYGIYHRITSVANPHANCRAELAVKQVKRLLRDNVGQSGTLDTAKFSRALLTMRNTPDRDTRKSPAQVLFGRQLRDFLPTPQKKLVREVWEKLADQRAYALARRGTKMTDSWTMRTRPLAPLKVGDSVFIQNQEGNYPCRWDKRGQVVEVKGYDQYIVRVDGSRRLTRRNRKFLRKFEPYRPDGMNAQQVQTP